MNLTNQDIKQNSENVIRLVGAGKSDAALSILNPILNEKCSFAKLDMLGKQIGKLGAEMKNSRGLFQLFDRIVDYNAMGGFVIVGQALIWFLPVDFKRVMEKSRDYIIKGDVWYVCDILGERSLGHALVSRFDETLPWLKTFLEDDNRWVKRSVGVAIHFFSKRVLNEPEKTRMLLDLVEPYIEEKQIDFVKGIGWGLKTIGRYHPELMVEFLIRQLPTKKMSALMLRKAITYLEEEKKRKVMTFTDPST